MGIMLPFNNALEYSFEQLSEITGMTPESLAANMALLVRAKVLLESDPGTGRNNIKYTLNKDFKNKKVRMNLNIAIKSETKQEVDETHKTIEKDRELVIQVLYTISRLTFLGGDRSNHENQKGNEARPVDAAGYRSFTEPFQTISPGYQKMY
jgi:ABC-type transport system substrate-binding protein